MRNLINGYMHLTVIHGARMNIFITTRITRSVFYFHTSIRLFSLLCLLHSFNKWNGHYDLWFVYLFAVTMRRRSQNSLQHFRCPIRHICRQLGSNLNWRKLSKLHFSLPIAHRFILYCRSVKSNKSVSHPNTHWKFYLEFCTVLNDSTRAYISIFVAVLLLIFLCMQIFTVDSRVNNYLFGWRDESERKRKEWIRRQQHTSNQNSIIPERFPFSHTQRSIAIFICYSRISSSRTRTSMQKKTNVLANRKLPIENVAYRMFANHKAERPLSVF